MTYYIIALIITGALLLSSIIITVRIDMHPELLSHVRLRRTQMALYIVSIISIWVSSMCLSRSMILSREEELINTIVAILLTLLCIHWIRRARNS